MRTHPDWIMTIEELHALNLFGSNENPGQDPVPKRPLPFVLLDVRQPEEYEEVHFPGCQLIPLGELLNRAESELTPESDIVIYCAHGIRSMHAVAALQRLGFKKLRSLEGGMAAWEELYGSPCSPR